MEYVCVKCGFETEDVKCHGEECEHIFQESCPSCATLRASLAKAEGELSALRERMTVEGLAKVLYENNALPTGEMAHENIKEEWTWEGMPEYMRDALMDDARAIVAHLEGKE